MNCNSRMTRNVEIQKKSEKNNETKDKGHGRNGYDAIFCCHTRRNTKGKTTPIWAKLRGSFVRREKDGG